jgi:shikimate kinase
VKKLLHFFIYLFSKNTPTITKTLTKEVNMKFIDICKEIDGKLNELCHEALKEGGLHMLGAVNQLSSALTQMVNYKPPVEEKKP